MTEERGYKDYRDEPEKAFPIDPYGEFDYIRIWPWDKAPPSVKQFSTHGGDEDGVAWIPSEFLTENPDQAAAEGWFLPTWIARLWDCYGTHQDFLHFRDGMLIIWAHA